MEVLMQLFIVIALVGLYVLYELTTRYSEVTAIIKEIPPEERGFAKRELRELIHTLVAQTVLVAISVFGDAIGIFLGQKSLYLTWEGLPVMALIVIIATLLALYVHKTAIAFLDLLKLIFPQAPIMTLTLFLSGVLHEKLNPFKKKRG